MSLPEPTSWPSMARTKSKGSSTPRSTPSPTSRLFITEKPGYGWPTHRQASTVVQAPRTTASASSVHHSDFSRNRVPLSPYAKPATVLLIARLNVQLGTTHECLPEPPATMTYMSSAEGTIGRSACSSVTFCIQSGQSCMPHMPPCLSRPSGSRACSKTKRWTSAAVNPSAAMVSACSGPRTTRSWLWLMYHPTLEPRVAATSETLLRIPAAVVETWSLTLWGPSPPNTVTTL